MVLHGFDGWTLEDMDWDPDSGVSRFEYSRVRDGKYEVFVMDRAQPTKPGHQDWDPFAPQATLAIGRIYT